jgi:hypothetical protein
MSEGALDACICCLLLKDMSCFLSAGALTTCMNTQCLLDIHKCICILQSLGNHWHFTLREVLERRNEKPTVGRPFFFGVWISHTALLHINSDTRNTTCMYKCICVSVFCSLLLQKMQRCRKPRVYMPYRFSCFPLPHMFCQCMPVYLSVCMCV